MSTAKLPHGWTVVVQPEGSTHYGRLLDQNGKFQRWVAAPVLPQDRLRRRVFAFAREFSRELDLSDNVLRLLLGGAKPDKKQSELIITEVAVALLQGKGGLRG